MQEAGNVDVITFGCRLNTYEAEVIREQAAKAGLSDAIVINTCAVTNEAVAQARQTIRKLARSRPDAAIIVTGCAAQIDPSQFVAMPEVTRVIGNDVKMQASTWHKLAGERGLDFPETQKAIVNDIMSVRETAHHLVEGVTGHTRAFVQVQNGCDHRCTFCIIPYGRGNSRSVPMGVVVEQVRSLVQNGSREVVLTGVDMTSYGKDLPGLPTLGALVASILRHVPELPRLRLSSIDSIEVDDVLLEAIATQPRFMPHLHLSLQAGDNLILKRMKRRHTREDAIAFCETVRRLRPDIVFGADIIAGFPTEDEDMFSRSLDLVEECGLTHLHVFPFSPRQGTPAARMPQLSVSLVKERAGRLRQAGERAFIHHLDSEVGHKRFVLTEKMNKGRTEGYTPVQFKQDVAPGMILQAQMTSHNGKELCASDA